MTHELLRFSEAPEPGQVAERVSVLIASATTAVTDRLLQHLRLEGYELTHVATAAEAFASLADRRPSLLALDVGLPDGTSSELVRRVRAHAEFSELPLIVIGPDSALDKVSAFEAGADDFIVTPPSLPEFSLRVRAVLRRATVHRTTATRALTLGAIRMDVDRHEVFVDRELIPMTALEFRVLLLLMRTPNKVQRRRLLLQAAWGTDSDALDRAVDATIKRLRRKLKGAGALIETVRSLGYRLSAPPTSRTS